MGNLQKNIALEVIKRIHSELVADNTTDNLSFIMQIILDETKASAVNLYVKADDVSLEEVCCSPNKESFLSIRVGDGIVGKVGLDNQISFIQSKKDFQIALPIKRWGKTTGVLHLTYKHTHKYDDTEVEFLETICMFLSEYIASEDVTTYIKKVIKSRGIVSKDKLKGVVINSGYALGNVVVHRRRKAVTEVFAKDKDAELKKLEDAKQKMNADLDVKLNRNNLENDEQIEILDAYRMMANDKGWYKRIINHINLGLTAEAAVEQAYTEMWNRLSNATDDYLKERLHDLRDIADRLRLYLSGEYCSPKKNDAFDNIVIVATSMGPADLMDYDYKKIKGLIIEECTPTMHVAIVAKTLNVPVISGIVGLFKEIKDGVAISIDGKEGVVVIDPSKSVVDKISKKIEEKEIEQKRIQKLKNLKSKTKDNKRINLYLNVGMDFDFDNIKNTQCDGVGLYRTEIPFMSAEKMPDITTQVAGYKKLHQAANGKKVIFRSLDVGSDKLLPYWNSISEENPAIGWRSIRITLDRRTILRKQMRAFIRASGGKELYVMFPMISNLDEFLEARETFMFAYEREKKAGFEMPQKVHLGMMIEVPSVVFQLREILKYCDFISIGTNDLYQFFFACDRGNPRLNGRYDVLSAPFLNMLKKIIKEANNAGVLCSVCGEMASSPIDAMALIGLGFRHLSVSSASYGKIKAMIRSLSVQGIEDYLNNILSSSRKSLRPQLKSYADDHAIEIY
ncbi:MAG: phosphoenolpyruvate--protein phosphotransferase [Alphaproteobacteria bacterium]|nr:phosphoenolpyruvate--protein phosphotransferase [Alphaproteobacteria bacterium]